MPTDRERNKQFNAEIKRQLKRRTRLQKDARHEIRRILKVALTRIESRLANRPSEFDVFSLPQVQQAIRGVLDGVGRELGDSGSQLTDDFFNAGADMVDKPIQAGGITLRGLIPTIDKTQLLAFQAFITDKMKDVTVTMANQINTELGLTAIGAQPLNSAVANIKTVLQDKGRKRATTILRTELLRAYGVANQLRKEQAEKVLPGLKKRWLPSGRTHARTHHEATRGQIQAVDAPFQLLSPGGIIKLSFPRDPKGGPAETINCGCESVPYMEHWELAA